MAASYNLTSKFGKEIVAPIWMVEVTAIDYQTQTPILTVLTEPGDSHFLQYQLPDGTVTIP